MATLKINEIRSVTYVGGVQTYEILVTCTSAGAWGDTGLFVQQIVSTRDPLADAFQRVAAVADIEAFGVDRDEAIAQGQSYWRSSSLKLTYEDVTTADQAVRILSDRINTLANDWQTYADSFETAGEVSSFPTTDPTYLTEVKTNYATAVDSFNTASETQANATTAVASATTATTEANTTVVEWKTEYGRYLGSILPDHSTTFGLSAYLAFSQSAFVDFLAATTTVVAAIDSLRTEAGSIISSNVDLALFFKLILNGFIAPTARDIGRPVRWKAGSDLKGSGVLSYIKVATREIWVSNITGTFDGVDLIVEVDRGSGDWEGLGTISDHSGQMQDPIKLAIETLTAARNTFQTALDNASLKAPTLANGVAFGLSSQAAVEDIVGQKEALYGEAQVALSTATQAKKAADGALAQAYIDVISAYEKVKEVCPDWSPDPPLPAQP